MPTIKPLLVIAIVGVLTACGSGSSGNNAAHFAKAKATHPTGDATALQVAAESRGDVNCPAKVKTPPRAPGMPADDVLGVRPGMTYEEAANVVLCSNPLLVVTDGSDRPFELNTYGQKVRQGFTARFAEPRVQKTSQQILDDMQREEQARSMNTVQQDMQPGESKWSVSTMGMPSQEKVVSVFREESFATGHNPTVDSLMQALVKKYGAPRFKDGTPGDYLLLYWDADIHGKPLTWEQRQVDRCGSIVNDGSMTLSGHCGTLVMAMVRPVRDNNDLARLLRVGVLDDAGAYNAIAATEKGLQQLDAQRRQREVQAAAKNADATQL